jgi:tetratricopeptide (TPR) repeat protein
MEVAEAFLLETLEQTPDSSQVFWHLSRVLAQQGRLEEAAATLERAQDLPGGQRALILSELAYVRGRQGRIDDARTAVTQLLKREKTEYINPYLLAIAHLSLGETDEVFRYLELAAETRSPWFPSLPVEPKFDVLRSDPRFARLIARLKLPD